MLTNITAKLGDELFFDGLDSIASAIRFLSISRSALYSLMERGELPYVKIGKSRRIPHRALVELASRHLVVSR